MELLYISGNKKSGKSSYIFSKESFSCISRKRILVLRRVLIYQEERPKAHKPNFPKKVINKFF